MKKLFNKFIDFEPKTELQKWLYAISITTIGIMAVCIILLTTIFLMVTFPILFGLSLIGIIGVCIAKSIKNEL